MEQLDAKLSSMSDEKLLEAIKTTGMNIETLDDMPHKALVNIAKGIILSNPQLREQAMKTL